MIGNPGHYVYNKNIDIYLLSTSSERTLVDNRKIVLNKKNIFEFLFDILILFACTSSECLNLKMYFSCKSVFKTNL